MMRASIGRDYQKAGMDGHGGPSSTGIRLLSRRCLVGMAALCLVAGIANLFFDSGCLTFGLRRGGSNGRSSSLWFSQAADKIATPPVALLVALPSGPEGKTALHAWSNFVLATLQGSLSNNHEDSRGYLLPTWVLTSDVTLVTKIRARMPHLEPVFVPSLASSSEVPAENVSTDTKGRVDIHEEIDSDGGREDRVEVYPEDLSNGPRADNGGGGGGGGSEGDIEEREDSNDERTRRRTSTRREHSQKAQSTPVSASRTAADISSSASWSDALESFLEAADDSATRDGHGPGVIDAFGVFGEGSLPPPGLAAAIESLWPALDRSTAPTAILSRSRLWVDSGRTHADSGGRDRWSEEHDGDWLPDTFISQVWCNRALLATARRDGTGLKDKTVADGLMLRDVIRRLIHDPGAIGARLVDGTEVMPARAIAVPSVLGATALPRVQVGPPSDAADSVDKEIGGERRAQELLTEEGTGLKWSSRNVENRAGSEEGTMKDGKQRHLQQRRVDDRRDGGTSRDLMDSARRSERTRHAGRATDADRGQNSTNPLGGGYGRGRYLSDNGEQQMSDDGASNFDADEDILYIGSLELGLIFDKTDGTPTDSGEKGLHGSHDDRENAASVSRDSGGDDGTPVMTGQSSDTTREGGKGYGRVRPSKIEVAPWPPRYVLEDIATRDAGVVTVTSVNCGYLDMAANFLLSVRRHSDVKVLFVAMDEVTFDYMDTMAPGCVALIPDTSSGRHHSVQAGVWGDAIFKAETVVRPDILLSILGQGFKVLWTDVDMVWMDDPLPLLPNRQLNATDAEVLLQIDGKPINRCTCFMYLDNTPNAVQLIHLWKKEIIDTQVSQNQMAFQAPLRYMEEEGLQLELLPDEVMPPGFKYFDRDFMKENEERYRDRIIIVHNNWVIGHDAKVIRFIDHRMWDVEHWDFPSCQ